MLIKRLSTIYESPSPQPRTEEEEEDDEDDEIYEMHMIN